MRRIWPVKGERGVFRAESDTPGKLAWRIDVENYNGHGECSCPDFSIRRAKCLKRGEQDPMLTMCKHLKEYHLRNSIAKNREELNLAKASNGNKHMSARWNSHNI